MSAVYRMDVMAQLAAKKQFINPRKFFFLFYTDARCRSRILFTAVDAETNAR